MAFKMRGWSYRNNGNDKNQDKVKSKEEQIKDLQGDIAKLMNRNNPGDGKKIQTLKSEIERIKKKNL
jgi:TolA-binding protein